jgi:hypothetical protein
MGILRTDTISGLETPTPVTGSVSFDGSGDRLQIENNDNFNFPGDFTIECWVYSITPLENYAIEYAHIAGKGNGIVASTYSLAFYQSKATFLKSTSGGSYSFITGTSILSNSVWYHFAVTRQSNVLKIFVNGILESSTTVSDNLTNSYSFNIGDRQSGDGSSQYPLNGYISNLRILKGTALYTSNFTPPTRELQPIGDTVLLCCNNPDSAGAEATGKTITVNGDAVASTFSPGLTRDFTYGTQFDGVSRFDTQGYFVPPSGNTQNRYTLGLDEIVTDGLVLHLDAGNPFSYPATGVGTHWTDLSGNNNHGTLVNGVSYTENNRGSLVFDGVNDYVDCGSPSISVGKITVNAWIKTNAGSIIQHIVDSASNAWHLAILDSNRPYFYNGSTYHESAPALTVGQWYMITGVQGETLDIYINGVLGQSIASNINVTTNNVNIGRWQGGGRQYNGNIAQVSIYNRALSAAEVSQNYEALKGRYGLP